MLDVRREERWTGRGGGGSVVLSQLHLSQVTEKCDRTHITHRQCQTIKQVIRSMDRRVERG